MDGIIVINKPYGITSHGVVHLIRKLFPGVKTGHSGTLDPMATGVLPVCLGRATRIVEYIIELPKTYRAAVTLGKTTDTEDATGHVLEVSPVPCLKEVEIEILLDKFTGIIEQFPPLYSAVKYRGKPFYHWTRKGESVPRKPRMVEIYRIELIEYCPEREPHLIIDVKCSRGTYIRTLAADIGKAIGCGGHLSSLIRSAVGPYKIEESLTPDELADKASRGSYYEFIRGMDTALEIFPKIIVGESELLALKQGKIIFPEPALLHDCILPDIPIRVYDMQGDFRAIAGSEQSSDSILRIKTIKYLS